MATNTEKISLSLDAFMAYKRKMADELLSIKSTLGEAYGNEVSSNIYQDVLNLDENSYGAFGLLYTIKNNIIGKPSIVTDDLEDPTIDADGNVINPWRFDSDFSTQATDERYGGSLSLTESTGVYQYVAYLMHCIGGDSSDTDSSFNKIIWDESTKSYTLGDTTARNTLVTSTGNGLAGLISMHAHWTANLEDQLDVVDTDQNYNATIAYYVANMLTPSSTINLSVDTDSGNTASSKSDSLLAALATYAKTVYDANSANGGIFSRLDDFDDFVDKMNTFFMGTDGTIDDNYGTPTTDSFSKVTTYPGYIPSIRKELDDIKNKRIGSSDSVEGSLKKRCADIESDVSGLHTTIGDDDTTGLRLRIKTNENDIDTLETTVGNSSGGLVKDVADLQNTVGDTDGGLVKDVDELQDTLGDGDSGLIKEVADLTTAVGDSSSGLVADTATLKTTVGDSESGLVAKVAALEERVESLLNLIQSLHSDYTVTWNGNSASAIAVTSKTEASDETSSDTSESSSSSDGTV